MAIASTRICGVQLRALSVVVGDIPVRRTRRKKILPPRHREHGVIDKLMFLKVAYFPFQ